MVYARLRILREARNLRQQDLADYLCCSQVCYSRYEQGSREIPIDALLKLAQFYQTSVDYILGLTERQEPYPASSPKIE